MINKLLDMQKTLDSKVKQSRNVGATDILLGMMAEIIECQEELPETYKTWKNKEYNESELKMEIVDILFFYLKLLNHFNITQEELEQLYCEKWLKNMNRIGDGNWR